MIWRTLFFVSFTRSIFSSHLLNRKLSSNFPIFIQLRSQEDIELLGSRFAAFVKTGDSILLKGDLGAGKTCFARGLIRSKLEENDLIITSPSYLIDNTYSFFENNKACMIHHMDLYRLPTGTDLSFIGIPNIYNSCICIIEWPQRIAESDMPESYIDIRISIGGDEIRTASINPVGDVWVSRLLGTDLLRMK